MEPPGSLRIGGPGGPMEAGPYAEVEHTLSSPLLVFALPHGALQLESEGGKQEEGPWS